ncbi:MAG: hypothetical protein Tsb007_37700 [Rhizobacter sp.]
MFLADQRFKFSFPSSLMRKGLEHFELVEAVMNEPIWLVHATQRNDAESLVSRRRILVSQPSQAVDLLGMPQWASKRLYVLLPEFMTGLPHLSMHVCKEVWRCDEPDNEAPCWRLSTERGAILCSLFGTPLGDESNPQLVWRDSQLDIEI